MRTRLTTPGLLIAAIAAVLVGGLAAFMFAGSRTPDPVAFGTAPAVSAQTVQINPASIYRARSTGVVTIESVFAEDTTTGSGFVVDNEGHIITAYHVAHDYIDNVAPRAIYIEFTTHDRVLATVVGLDPFNDLAVLKVDPSQVKLHPVPLGNSDTLVVGEPVVAIGAPFSLGGSQSVGNISRLHGMVPSRINERSSIADVVQTDVVINKGNSGGPMFNRRGEVIGLNQQIDTEDGNSAGVSHSVPVNTIKRSLRQIIATGTVQQAWLGLVTSTVSPQLAKAYDLPSTYGVLVSAASGPAAAAGLTGGREISYMGQNISLGDEIVQIAGLKIQSKEDVSRVAARIDVGQKVQVVYFRSGQRYTTTLVARAKA